MRSVARVLAMSIAVTTAAGRARADTYRIDFGAPGQAEYNGDDSGNVGIVNRSNPRDIVSRNALTGIDTYTITKINVRGHTGQADVAGANRAIESAKGK